ncbi:Serine hydroxymethyltransferase 3, chloroplastic [Aduncisulcus paluster]|uniref:Serine hydroxymethyltransferase n=1 Tax=Aduncisulcus paluster TaxID=2918883 RepID=A0ABQ5KKI9_9EUKA|nr:Serine hydroxymethyltransferase 3, chloroplastic [Aduncisulcus paluster]|eukprot:gnl/Carplike_NY0171/1354_a1841_1558.p1 GENE.gnl/Carplike_NY0171/1354_a1841_1558~~gnl/Carplike_NY0171/1354_a1841_1558.p1  ORF type:complete len:476 (+),score=170.18 gnl/Carplike_NY0171/1354_a1841_1558:1-1428(+)
MLSRAVSKGFATSLAKTRPFIGNRHLETVDPEIFRLIQREEQRQFSEIQLIASESSASTAVIEALGSCLTSKYSEGYPKARYYGGNIVIDEVEMLAQSRALDLFGLSPDEWHVNVQPYSGSPANLAVYTGLLKPHDRLMGLDLPDGGHLTHGFRNARGAVSATGLFFESLPYHLDPATGLIDYDALEKSALNYRPKLLICGASSYPRHIDFARMRSIADKVGAILMCDMAHIAGLVAAGAHPSPFPYCDVVTSTTHKTLRGPRAGIIFCRKEFAKKIDAAVFPGLQGGPHDNAIAAMAVAFKEAKEPEFKECQFQVVKNASALGKRLVKGGVKLVSGGTDNHICLCDVKSSLGIDGARVERVLELSHISVNKNSVPGDKSAFVPGGLRLGTPLLTSRGMDEKDMEKVGDFLLEGIDIARTLKKTTGTKKLKEFKRAVDGMGGARIKEIAELGKKVVDFTSQFPIPGIDAGKFGFM